MLRGYLRLIRANRNFRLLWLAQRRLYTLRSLAPEARVFGSADGDLRLLTSLTS